MQGNCDTVSPTGGRNAL